MGHRDAMFDCRVQRTRRSRVSTLAKTSPQKHTFLTNYIKFNLIKAKTGKTEKINCRKIILEKHLTTINTIFTNFKSFIPSIVVLKIIIIICEQ